MGGVVTFLLTDVVHSTALWEQDSVEMAASLARHDTIVKEGVARNRGRLVKARGEGDSHFVVFESALDAAMAAVEIQRDLQDEDWTTAAPLRVRIAVHLGEVEERGEDYYGPEVNRAARMRAIGHGGQILVSSPVRELIHHRLPSHCWLVDLGEHRLKDLLRAEHVYQLAAEGLSQEFPKLAALNAECTNLPTQLMSFIGREDDIEAVRTLLMGNRLVTLIGPGGCGKTRLAIQSAAESSDVFPDGIWFVDLAPVEAEDGVERAVAASLPLKLSPAMDLKQNLSAFLESKGLLLVLDNCEHLGSDPAKFLSFILKAAPEVRCIATSRRALGIGPEHTYVVRPLTRPQTGASTRKKVLANESAQLLAERAYAKAPSFQVTDGNAAAVGDLCRALEGMPLAIELAASRLKLLSPDQLYSRLSKSLDLLKGGATDADERHRTLRATINWSFQLLNPEEAALLCRLSLLPAGCSLDVAEIVGADLADEGHDILDLLEALVNNSLLQVEGADLPRYRMLETIRQYCAEKLMPGVDEGVFGRLLPWSIDFARTTKPLLNGSEQKQTLARLDAEYENLRACLAWAAGHEKADDLLALASELDRFWFRSGTTAEGLVWLERALEWDEGDPAKRAVALRSAGTFASEARDYTHAIELLGRSVDACRQAGNEALLGGALSNLGMAQMDLGDCEAAVESFEQALSAARMLNDQALIGLVLQNLGWVKGAQGKLDEAMSRYEEARALVDGKPEGQYTLAVILSNMAGIYRMRGDFREAAKTLGKSIAITRELNNQQLLGEHVLNLSRVAYGERHYEIAARLLGCCRNTWKSTSYIPSSQNAEIAAEMEANLREELSPADLAEGLSSGMGMKAEEVAEYALASVDLILM